MNRINALAVAVCITVMAGHSFAGFAYPARTMESVVLGRTVDYSLIAPMSYLSDPTSRYPVLFALHGANSNYDAYISMTNIRDSVEAYPMLVVAFTASTTKYREETEFLIGEFKPFIDSVYRTDGQYAITGFSMGGYGAFHFMCNHPALFKSVSAKSGAFYSGGDRSINDRLKVLKDAGTDLPPIYMNCGTLDDWISNQREMKDTLSSLGYAYEYYETPGMDHDYTFWHATMKELIPWHGQYFDYTSGVTDRGATAPAVAAGVSPNPSHRIFSVVGMNAGTVGIVTTGGAFVASVPVVDGCANWRAAAPGISDGVYVITREDGSALARVMLVR